MAPPTERVVGVLNLLAGQDSGISVPRRLDMTSSTCATLLSALDSADYVERSADKTYRLGSGLLALAQALHARFPLLGAAHDELSQLCAELQCAATLTRIAFDPDLPIFDHAHRRWLSGHMGRRVSGRR
jgi:DNA-binding IclR family transcriptional regulator